MPRETGASKRIPPREESRSLSGGNFRRVKRDVRVWGLTGGIAAGKSTVAKILEENGVPVIDADTVARDLSREGGAAHELIRKRFGTADPAALRTLVFSDPEAKRDLESILHPLIVSESASRIRAAADERLGSGASPPVLVVYEAALLIETGRYRDFDGLLLVSAPEEVRVRRIMKTRGLDESTSRKILAAQMPDSEKRRVATRVIENSGSLEELRGEVARALEEMSA